MKSEPIDENTEQLPTIGSKRKSASTSDSTPPKQQKLGNDAQSMQIPLSLSEEVRDFLKDSSVSEEFLLYAWLRVDRLTVALVELDTDMPCLLCDSPIREEYGPFFSVRQSCARARVSRWDLIRDESPLLVFEQAQIPGYRMQFLIQRTTKELPPGDRTYWNTVGSNTFPVFHP